ncbi:IS3 family transposase [Klebsiella pneumoniae]|uniref:IS3 family transposase n=1 Tax=Klebsiella pneumoniae TaxID=573 RepID=UPI0013D152F3|nr:IS3 family transposase [Klebsiella pneumoniae]MCZ9487230.1 IS3 family transposase [Klebsiella pneumoniae]HBQ2207189.1 IS3 family transposase [Klebsiella pneumoniae]HBW5187991.1 IS3 family transposase [Klebsiella pneumoniae]HBW5286981.1 IS3 family transposase [Klebsiella pneumoniae]HBW6529349.1 IS3 family transposase [Klebsiella pneumoniae]
MFKECPVQRIEVITGEQKRRRYTPEEKARFVALAMQPGYTVSLVARQYGITPSLIFKWKRLMNEGGKSAIAAGDEVLSVSELKALEKKVKQLEQMLGRKTMEAEILRDALEIAQGKKVDIAHAIAATGRYPLIRIAEVLCVSRSNLYDRLLDKRQHRSARYSKDDDARLLPLIRQICSERATNGYRRVTAHLNRALKEHNWRVNPKRVYRIMRQNALLLERKPAIPPSKRAHTGRVAVKESNQRWCSDGFEFRCDNGEKLRVTFALDCCDREALHWAVTTGGFDSETVQDVMLGAVERRFGSELPASPVEWLTDNGSCYRANETRQFARMLGLEPKNTAVRSPESNGIAESFVKTIKRDYINIMPKPDGLTAAKNLAEAFEHYNEWHPHSALGYRSPREYLRQRASNGLSDNRCLEI